MKGLRKLAILSAGALSLMNVSAVFPAEISVSAAEEAAAWRFDEKTGALTISGDWKDVSGEAFYPWAKLKGDASPVLSVVFADGMTKIPDAALYDFQNVTSVSVPDSVTKLGASAFQNCTALKEISLPETLTEIGAGAFLNTRWLDERRAENPLVVLCGILIDGRTCTGTVQVPDSVTAIAPNAFYGNADMTEIRIADSVKKIGASAFACCESLEKAELPKQMTALPEKAFYTCKSLKSVVMQAGAAEIGSHAFAECRSLTDITIPETVNRIADEVFAGTAWLTAQQRKNPLVIVNSVLIDGSTCTGEAVIPEGVTEILPGAFMLSKVTALTVPEGVTEIPAKMCSFCTELTAVRIPETAVSVGDAAFMDCKKLIQIVIPAGVKTFGKDVFSGGDVTLTAYEGSAAEQYAAQEKIPFAALQSEPAVSLAGDANTDGAFDIADAVLTAKYIVADTEAVITDAGKMNADVTGDGKIQTDDVTAMLKRIAKKISVFPAEEKDQA